MRSRLAVLAAAMAAGLTFRPAFDPAIGLAAAVVGTAAVVATVLPRHWWALPFLATGPVAAMLTLRDPLGPWQRLVDGPGDALRLTLPLPGELIVVPATLTGLAAVAGSVLVRRRPGGLEALLPAAVAGGFGTVAAGLHSVQTGPVCLGLGAAALLTARNWRPVTLLVVAVVGLPLFWLPQRAAPGVADPRDRLRPEARVAAGIDVLDQVGGWMSAPARTELFRVDAGPVRGWRLAVLDVYDGETWRTSGRFLPAGLGVPPHRGPVPREAVTHRVEVADLRGPYLPAADRPIRVAPPVDAVEPDTGVLLTSREVASGLRYDVVSRSRPAATPRSADTAATGAVGELAVPDELRGPVRAFLDGVPTRSGTGVAEKANAVQQFLRAQRRNVAGAPSSAGSAAVRDLLGADGTGTTVQFATAFALAMRSAGVPARVVVGFESDDATVRVRDVRVWPELHYAAAGWVRYDPTPPLTRATSPVRPDDPPPAPMPTASPTLAPTPATPPPAASGLPTHRLVLALSIVAAVIVAGALVVLIARRAWRRRRRHSPDERVVAAWQDVLRAYPSGGRESLTPARLHEHLSKRLPEGITESSLALSRLASRALYSSRSCTAEDGDLAWRASTVVRRALGRVKR
jgi:transglutaminase-like putative cysteine protease